MRAYAHVSVESLIKKPAKADKLLKDFPLRNSLDPKNKHYISACEIPWTSFFSPTAVCWHFHWICSLNNSSCTVVLVGMLGDPVVILCIFGICGSNLTKDLTFTKENVYCIFCSNKRLFPSLWSLVILPLLFFSSILQRESFASVWQNSVLLKSSCYNVSSSRKTSFQFWI